MKRISQESIENIRSDGSVFNINVDEKTSGTKSHLPGSPQESKYSQPKQVRVILIHQKGCDYHLQTICYDADGLPNSILCTSHAAT